MFGTENKKYLALDNLIRGTRNQERDLFKAVFIYKNKLTASNSFKALTTLFGALISEAVCLVRHLSEVHTVIWSRQAKEFMCSARALA